MARSFFSLPAAAPQPQSSANAPVSQRMLVLSLCLVLAGMMGGALISLRWQEATSPTQPATERQGNSSMVAATISRLETEQETLRAQITDLRDKMSGMQAEQARDKSTLADVTSEIERQRVAAGLVPLTGSGIIAQFDDSSADEVLPNEDPANYILHDYDLRDMVNTLWAAGAEAISVNGERVVSTTSLYCVGTTIILNVTRLSPPYAITAIGNPDALEAALQGAPQMASFNQRAMIYDLPVAISREASVLVPAYDGSITFRNASASDESSGEPTLTPSR